MTIDDAKDYLREHWPDIRAQLLEGTGLGQFRRQLAATAV
jgi:hypothetical protein